MSVRSGFTLGDVSIGFHGRIRKIVPPSDGVLPRAELERRLLEMGFVEGATVKLCHQGLFGRDPIAVRIQDATVALRRREARAIQVEALS